MNVDELLVNASGRTNIHGNDDRRKGFRVNVVSSNIQVGNPMVSHGLVDEFHVPHALLHWKQHISLFAVSS